MPIITLPDGSQRSFDHPVSVLEVAQSIGAGLAKATLAGKVNGKQVDACDLIETDATLQIITPKDEEGLEIIDEMRRNDEKVIFLVPHGWGVDIPAMLMASQGQKMAAMFHNQGNKIYDFVWNTVRRRFGGRLHARNALLIYAQAPRRPTKSSR